VLTTPRADKIVLARESRGLTQGDLADATKRTQGFISKVEGRVKPAPDEFVQELAVALKYPVSLFYQDDQILSSPIDDLFHRRRKTTASRPLKTLHAQVNLRRIQIARLLSPFDVEGSIPQIPSDEVDETPEDIARSVRSALLIPPGPIENLTEALELAGAVVVRFDFGISQVDGMSLWNGRMPPLLFVNSAIPRSRARITLAHELGHLVMHPHPTPGAEEEATRFASEFLVPEDEFAVDPRGVTLDSLAKLKPLWKVSIAALLMKAAKKGLVTKHQEKWLWIKLGKAGYRRSEPLEDALPDERPNVVSTLVDRHLKELDYSVEELAAAVHLRREEFLQHYVEKPGLRLVG
jgi:Zn-dependent peptidase ImmA (M78 family)